MIDFPEVRRVGITIQNIDEYIDDITTAVKTANIIGLDIETEDSGRHQGLTDYMRESEKLLFDVKRTTVCGLSLWPDNHHTAYYFNLAHADVHARIPWRIMEAILNMKQPGAVWIIHNAVFERTMLKAGLNTNGFMIKDYICTLVMAVSAYGPDEYDVEAFKAAGLGGMHALAEEIISTCRGFEENEDVTALMGKIIGKDSNANHSYNFFARELAYGYGLKQAVRSWFGYQMRTFEETLGDREHMGQLTTAEVFYYGCDDAIWCVRLYHRLLQFMMETNPTVVSTFFLQELPMVEEYSEVWLNGVQINAEAVARKQVELREDFADATRRLKVAIRKLLPFPAQPHEKLAERDDWYADNHKKYRDKIAAWANSPDVTDTFDQCSQLSGAIPNAWAIELGRTLKGKAKAAQLNVTHYMPMRTLMYDLFQERLILSKGKVQSDAYSRGRLKERLVKQGKTDCVDVMDIIGQMATMEQVAKLFITPYMKLIDPATGKMHPVLGSDLASRRTSMQTPNAQQLSKRNPETTYVRGFYEADAEDHVIVSIDWSQIELVLIGEESGDPYFHECYSELPYTDLHIIACEDVLEVTREEFLGLKDGTTTEGKLLLNPKGEVMDPKTAFKYWRTEVGKGSNFSYWYSGALNQVGERLGWSSDEMFAASDRYRAKFTVGEQWRRDQIEHGQLHGFVTLRDGHRRVKYEATPEWAQHFRAKWARYDCAEIRWFIDKVIRRLQSRANNQLVNSKIQGTCATIAKRSIPVIRKMAEGRGWGSDRVRFMFLVHDELVFSVHRDLVTEFVPEAMRIMNDHPEIVSTLKMDCSPSVGLTFEPWHAKRARIGQVELREAPPLDFIEKEKVGKEIPLSQWGQVVNWLYEERDRLRSSV